MVSVPTHISGWLSHSLATSSLLQAVGVNAGECASLLLPLQGTSAEPTPRPGAFAQPVGTALCAASLLYPPLERARVAPEP
jgi:hypothetical protein